MLFNKTKKLLTAALALWVCLCFCACSGDGSDDSAVTVTSSNSNSSYVASRTDVVSEEAAPVTTVPSTTTTPAVTTSLTEPTVTEAPPKTTPVTSVTTAPDTSKPTETTTAPKEELLPVVSTSPKDNGLLLTEGLSEDERALYDSISSAVAGFEKVITFEGKTVTQQQIEDCLLLISLANVEDFYVSPQYVVTVDEEGFVSKLELEFTKSKGQHTEEHKKLRAVIDEIVAGCTATNEYELVKYLHDEIIKRCRYDSEAENMLNAYGCLVEGKAVCEGYAKAFMLLCSEYGIDCLPVIGNSLSSDGVSEPHMWNLVKIDGMWYHMDLTWDDPITTVGEDFIKYDYFALGDKAVALDHEITPIVHFEYPEAFNEYGNYFVKSSLEFPNAQTAVNALEKEIEAAVSKEERFVRIKLTNKAAYDELNRLLFEADESGYKEIFRVLSRVYEKTDSRYFNPRRYSKTLSDDKYIITIILNYE